jgi:TrmH family RNA methyltransferase
MKVNSITSESNALLKRLRSLHQRSGREKSGLFLIEGPKALEEAHQKGIHIRDVVVSESFWKEGPAAIGSLDIQEVAVVDDRIFKGLVTTTSACGIAAIVALPRTDPTRMFKQKDALVVVGMALQDPGNLGTLIRTALAASASGIILTKGTVDPYCPKVVRSAAGALFALPVLYDITTGDAINLLKEHQVRVLACDMHGEKHYFQADLTGRCSIVVANEGQGFAAETLAACDEIISIPMNQESESLNVATAAAVVLFAAVEQRLRKGG